ncbi:hypothetical protein [Microbacterium sp. SSM24]|uniref:hypothetical protein n=1 Tax=Microbacterium sp. SSM24 TaxID=2991714 RepID=UPI0022261DC6|nr:hypothetical protein [Microbacterium sp. SSM24]MCW3492630.1 hypothetical protein [Microbacterium sp. SSM24]
MSTQAPPFLRGLIDDAAIFPPGELPLADAVIAHAAYRADPWLTSIVGPLTVPTAALHDAALHASALDDPIDVSVIASTGVGAALLEVMRHPRLTLAAVELPTGVRAWREAVTAIVDARDALDRREPAGPAPSLFVEPGWPLLHEAPTATLGALTDARAALKLRTGGLVAEAFPSVDDLAAVIWRANAQGVEFKCTAGLHSAIRHRDDRTGFEHHGFLNILWAAAVARDGGDVSDIAAALSRKDAAAVASAVRELDPGDVSGARALFVSYGSCSISEPLDDLRALGLLDEEVAA